MRRGRKPKSIALVGSTTEPVDVRIPRWLLAAVEERFGAGFAFSNDRGDARGAAALGAQVIGPGRRRSMSSLGVLVECPGAHSLDWFGEAGGAVTRRGSVAAAYFQAWREVGREEALRQAPAEHLPWLESIDELPLAGTLAHAEAIYALDVPAGTARFIGLAKDRGARAYDDIPEHELPGSLDVVCVEGEEGWIEEIKTGFVEQPPPKKHWQLKGQVVAVALAHGLRRVHATVRTIRTDGRPWVQRDVFDEFDIDDTLSELQAAWERNAREVRTRAAGRTPWLEIGDHCRYCPAKIGCPTVHHLVRSVAERGEDALARTGTLDNVTVALDMGHARDAWRKAKLVHDLSGKLLQAIRQIAATHPIDLDNGKVLGLVEGEKMKVDIEKAWPLLEAALGEHAAATVKRTSSKSAIIEAARRVKRGLAPKLIDQLIEAGAITVEPDTSIEEYTP